MTSTSRNEHASQEKLRNEAQPLDFPALSESQQAAALKIHGFLQDAYGHSENARVDERRNHVLLISGAKGSGKTTVVMSLRKWFTDGRSGSSNSRSGSDLQSTIFQNAREFERLIWLDPIVMDPLHPGTNLIAAVFARITQAAAREEQWQARKSRGLLDPIGAVDRALHELSSLQSDAVMALEGNLHERRPHMDPESYAIAATENEKAKHEIALRLDRALKRLLMGPEDRADSTFKGLFVLPVDDLDSSPVRAVEMLKLAYTLSVPRLLFLLLGSAENADQVLFYSIQGEYFSILRQNTDPVELERVAATANEIASSSLRKFAPPSQRIHLEPLTIERALKFGSGPQERAQDSDAKQGSHGESSLETLLGTVSIKSPKALSTRHLKEHQQAKVTLHQLLLARESCQERSADAKGASPGDPSPRLENEARRRPEPPYIYDGHLILRTSPRQLADFYALLVQSVRPDRPFEHLPQTQEAGAVTKALAKSFFHDVFRPLVDEDGALTPSVQSSLKASLHSDDFAGEVDLDPPGLQRVLEMGDFLQFDLVPCPEANRLRVGARRVRSVELEAVPEGGGRARRLAEQTRAAFKVAHDLVRFAQLGNITGEIGYKNIADLAFTEWDDGVNEPFRVPWFSIQWQTFWHEDVFFRAWNNGLRWIRKICRERAELHAEHFVPLLGLTGAAALLEAADAGFVDNSPILSSKENTPLSSLKGLASKPEERDAVAASVPSDGKQNPSTWRLHKEHKESPIGLIEAAKELARHAAAKYDAGLEDEELAQIELVLIDLLLLCCVETGLSPSCVESGSAKAPSNLSSVFGSISKAIWAALQPRSSLSNRILRTVTLRRIERLGIHAHSDLGGKWLLCTNTADEPPESKIGIFKERHRLNLVRRGLLPLTGEEKSRHKKKKVVEHRSSSPRGSSDEIL